MYYGSGCLAEGFERVWEIRIVLFVAAQEGFKSVLEAERDRIPGFVIDLDLAFFRSTRRPDPPPP